MSEQDQKQDDKKGEELTAEDLEQVAGGSSSGGGTLATAGEKPLEFLKIKMTNF